MFIWSLFFKGQNKLLGLLSFYENSAFIFTIFGLISGLFSFFGPMISAFWDFGLLCFGLPYRARKYKRKISCKYTQEEHSTHKIKYWIYRWHSFYNLRKTYVWYIPTKDFTKIINLSMKFLWIIKLYLKFHHKIVVQVKIFAFDVFF